MLGTLVSNGTHVRKSELKNFLEALGFLPGPMLLLASPLLVVVSGEVKLGRVEERGSSYIKSTKAGTFHDQTSSAKPFSEVGEHGKLENSWACGVCQM